MTWIDRLYASAYITLGARYVEFWLAVSGFGIALLAWPAQQYVQFLLWGRDPSDARVLGLALLCGAVLSLAFMVWAAWVPFRPVILFLRRAPVAPEAVWFSAVRSLPRIATMAVLVFCLIGNTIVVAVAGMPRGFGWLEYVGAWCTASIVTATAGFFYILVWEVAFRPVLRDVDPLLPADFAPDDHWLTLTRRSAIAMTSVMLYTGIAVSGAVVGFDSAAGRMWASVIGTLAAATSFGGVISWLVSHSIFSRVSDLRLALEAIGEGDYDVRVALRMGDELDAAGRVLNEMAARLKRHDDDLRESRARITWVEQEERRRIERDLRVEVDQRLERLARQLDAFEAKNDGLEAEWADLHSTLNAARTEIRALAHGIFPALLESHGLGRALGDAVERIGLDARVELDHLGRLPPEVEAAAYFCCSEALQNVAKHAGDDAQVHVTVGVHDRVLRFVVQDTGIGFHGRGEGHGLANMRDRVRAFGGDLQITSVPGSGTTVAGWLAMDAEADGHTRHEDAVLLS